MITPEPNFLEMDDKFRAFVETTPDTIIIADETSKIIFCNQQIQKIFGYTPQEVLHQPLSMLVPLPYRAAHQNEMQRFLQHKRTKLENSTTEMPGLRKDGTVVPTELSLSCWREKARTYFSAIIRDISDRKKTEESLEEEREYLQAILENTGEAIISCDENGLINFFNRAAREKLGLDETSFYPVQRADYFTLYYPDGSTAMPLEDMPLYKALKGLPVKDDEFMIVTKNGSRLVLIANGKQLVSKEGKILGAVVVVHDETNKRRTTASLIDKNRQILRAYKELKEAERKLIDANNALEARVTARTEELIAKNQELNFYNEALQKANTDLDNFLYIASHDLKVPLVNMEQLLRWLYLDIPNKNEAVTDLLHKLELSVTRMKKTIQAIIEVAKVQKQIQYQREQIYLEDLLAEITESIAEHIAAARARVEYNFSAVPSLEFSYVNLKSILYNLLTNAIKYKAPNRNPHIKISTHRFPEYVALRVQDNGLGIDLDKNRPKLFGMFSRLHDHVEGSGIGLYIIKRMIENAGGYIEVASELGAGSAFTVYFRNHK